ncbi:bifunctional metallophosphatase/5'-nucleotidase [Tuanshanicoccus lijuaniae]|uniref:bifunctional metallophosphatase/5'-nucleotidase n=1 Tax=Aerococcaceae bacterium zg-1292 TaxID=2774330 RepID=UPI00193787D8|nr:bifunctional metallophosphatase/5'-nucleotidase [Aerococcaceae bacterium zg-1292]MBF6978332.1 bifunctional metallophosphatase/5'-nucleotidase [Aerococcaceae bacterium zg-BR22]QQA37373.1 bifunctional metallophosphatase/5'-nucleotidase [Aerococcaceae bacterium zg-1292]
MKKISFLMTSDTHGYWLDRPNNPDANLLNTAQVLTAIRQQNQHPTITIDLGDFIQGSSFATYCSQVAKNGDCFARAMNALDYDFQIIGNHEFNFGPDYRNGILEQLNAQVLVSNIIDEETNQPFIGKPYEVIECDGVKIGIIGVTTHYIPNWELPAHYEGLRFDDAFETTKYWCQQLRPHVDVLVVAYHGGFERDLDTFEPLEALKGENQGAQMLREIPEMDVLLTGHQHRYINQKVNHTWAIQPGHAGEWVAEVVVTVDDNHQVVDSVGFLHETTMVPVASQLVPVLEPQYSHGKAWLNTVLGQAPIIQPTTDIFQARVAGHPFVELLNQVQKTVTGAEFSGVALVNEFFALFEGDITNEILLKAYPYYNLIATVRMTGREIYEVMAFDFEYFQLNDVGEMIVNPTYIDPKPKHYNYDMYSGFTTYVDMTKTNGERIVSIVDERTGQPIELDNVYTLAISQYRAVGGGDYTMFTKDKIQSISEIDIATALVKALETFDAAKWQQINQDYNHVVWHSGESNTLEDEVERCK